MTATDPSLAALAENVAAGNITRETVFAIDRGIDTGVADLRTLLVIGDAMLGINQLILAEKAYRRALALAPGEDVIKAALAETLRLLSHTAESRALFEAVAAGTGPWPAREMARLKAAGTLPTIMASVEDAAADRARLAEALAAPPAETVPDILAIGGFTNFYLAYHAEDDRALQQTLAQYYLKLCPSLAFRAAHVDAPARTEQKIKLGMVSRHFNSHTIGYLNHGLITGLDRKAFELTLFRIPSGRPPDAMADALAKAADHVCDLPYGLAQAREAIAARRMDVLHYPDLGMEHLGYFLAFARLAKVQTVGWGHPVTTGIPAVDLFLSVDAMEPENGEQHYSERLVRLAANVPAVPRPDTTAGTEGKAAFGMEPAKPAYLCAQSLFKVHPDFDSVIAALLRTDPDGIVYFVGLWDHANDLFLSRLSGTIGADMNRVRLLPRVFPDRFPSLLSAADVLLDVPQWSGGRTSLEAFAVGKPVVHWPGRFMRGRHTLSFYRHMGVLDCVADSAESYVDIATRLMRDADFRGRMHGLIRECAPRLFNDTASVREMEAVWRRALAGNP